MSVLTDFPAGAILIPAHDEALAIDRALLRLAPLAELGSVEICVICNGCKDDTAERARRHHGVNVIEIDPASKTAALNAGDAWASRWPRLYLDAGVEIDPDAIARVFRTLHGSVPVARPLYRFDTSGASATVRAYYRARRRLPSTRFALWGAGVYALSRVGHERFDAFPPATPDDLFIDRLFAPAEKHIVTTVPVRVRTPRTTAALLAILRHNHRVISKVHHASAFTSVRELMQSIRGFTSALDALVYTSLAILSRAAVPPGRNGHLEPGPRADRSIRLAITRSTP